MPTISPTYASIFNLIGNVDKATHLAWCESIEDALAAVPSLPLGNAQFSNMAAGTLKANLGSTAAPPSDATVAALKAALNITAGDITGLGPLAAVSSVSNDILNNMAAGTVKANVTASAGDPADVLFSDFVQALPIFDTDLRGVVPAPDATAVSNGYLLKADGTWSAVSGPGLGDVTGPAGATNGSIALFDGAAGKVVRQGPTISAAAVTAFLGAADAKAARAAIDAADENLLLNGDFQINQRAFAGGSVGAYTYCFDRWRGDAAGANISRSGYVVTLSSGAIAQSVEPPRFGYANLASQQITVSVDTPSADITVTAGASASGTITAGSGRRGVTLTLGAGDTGNIVVKLNKATAGTVTFSRVKMEVGPAATAWRARLAASELAACRYYFQRIQALSGIFLCPTTRQGTIYLAMYLSLLAPIRAGGTGFSTSVPAWVAAAPTGNQIAAYNISTGAYITISGALSYAFSGGTETLVRVLLQAGTSFSGTAGDTAMIQAGASAYFDVSSEI